jgi:hypothetical protein
MSATPDAAIDQLKQDRAALAAQRGALPPDPSADILAQKQAALAPVEKAITEASGNLPPAVAPAALPQAPKPTIDPDSYSKLSAVLVAMAGIAGAKSGNWLAAASSLNGAIKGHIEGNEERSKQEWDKYQADYDKAVEQHKEEQQEYLDVLENKRLSINQKFDQWRMIAAKYDDQAKLALARQKRYDEMSKAIYGMDHQIATVSVSQEKVKSQAGGSSDPKVREVYAAMSDAGISFPPGMRSVKAQNETILGLLQAHPDDSATEIAARVKAGELGVKAAQTELGVVARREGASAAAINALNRDGGLYDQLLETAKKIDFGSSKYANSLRLWSQGQAIADPDISEYVNALADTRAEFASVLARGGQVTDSVRIASEHAFPDKMSLGELTRNVDRSKKIAASIQAGNTSVADALINGRSMEEALKSGAAPAAAKAPKPYADAEKERRYQEWKRAHPDFQ